MFSYSVYGAHVCGAEGVACQTEPVSPPPCNSGDSCKPAPGPQPEIYGPAPSATFSGQGNVTPEVAPAAKRAAKKAVGCKRGFVRRHGKCVRVKAKKRKGKR